jgi:hypothetical protein
MAKMHKIGRVACLSAGVFVLSCRGVEEQTLSKFFDAVRSGDHVTLLGMSVVGFSGPIESWDVIEVHSESRAPFRVPDLRQRQKQIEEERKQRFVEYMEFVKANPQELAMIRARMDSDPDYRFQGEWGELQREWESFRDREDEWHRKRLEVMRVLEQERKLSKMSLMSSEEIDELEGDVITRQVLVNVDKSESGERPYLFTLRKYDLTRPGTEYKPPSKWIIAGIEEEPESSGARESKN